MRDAAHARLLEAGDLDDLEVTTNALVRLEDRDPHGLFGIA